MKTSARAVVRTVFPLLVCGIVSCVQTKRAESVERPSGPTAPPPTAQTTPAVQPEPDPPSPVWAEPADQDSFVAGDLIFPGDAISRYLSGFPESEQQSVPTWAGMEQAIRDKYREIMVRISAFRDFGSVDVGFDSQYNRYAFSVQFQITREDPARVGYVDLSQVSERFREARIPVNFTITYNGAYIFAIVNPDELETASSEQATERNAFYTLEHLSTVFAASGFSGSAPGEPPLTRRFPSGFPTQILVLGSLELSARPWFLNFSNSVEYVMTGGDGQGTISLADLKKKAFAFDKQQVLTCAGAFVVTHAEAQGSLELLLHTEKTNRPGGAVLSMEGDLLFPMVTLGGSVSLTEATLRFDGSADNATLEAHVRPADLGALMPEGLPGALVSEEATTVAGVYDFTASQFRGSVGQTPVQVTASLAVAASASTAASTSQLYTLLAVFPDITGKTCEFISEPPDYPSALVPANRLHIGTTQRVLGWDPPAERWRPADWEPTSYIGPGVHSVWTEEDLKPQEPAVPPDVGEFADSGDGVEVWGRGFYALGCSFQPRFYLLIVAYWEGRSSLSRPGRDEIFQYRLFTVGLDGKLIHQLDLFSGEREGLGYPDTETYGESRGRLLMQPDLSFAVENTHIGEGGQTQILSYRVDRDGHLYMVE